MTYELYYWPGIQGRGEFVRLALEYADLDYVDIARGSEKSSQGMPALLHFLEDADLVTAPFAPPFLKTGDQIIGQTANILMYLGLHHELLAPNDAADRLWVHQLQLTVTDLVAEIHDSHHPIAGELYYDEQKPEAARRTENLRTSRLPKYLDYFEGIIAANPHSDQHLAGNVTSYADLSLFQLIDGLKYAFPNRMAEIEMDYSHLHALYMLIRQHPRIAAYLSSERRLPFNEQGIFRHYAELDPA